MAHRITSREEFASWASVWTDLAARSGRTTPFMSHEWFSCCWRAVGSDARPEAILLRDSAGPVAVVPLVHRFVWRRGLPLRRLMLMECPDTPSVDIVAIGDVRMVLRALLEHLESRSDWDVLSFQKVPGASPTLKALETELTGWMRWREVGTLASPYLSIEGSWEDFYGARSQRFKKTARNVQNRLERLGAVVIEEHRSVAADSDVFREMIDLTARSWKADRGVAIATMPGMHQFFRELSPSASTRGWLSLWFLRLNGRPIAMEYQLQADGVVHALRADYDLAHAPVSPGSALNFAIARALFQRGGVHEYDMGPGLNDYKMRWASGTRETVDLEVYQRGLYPRLVQALETSVIPFARRLREGLR